MTRVPDFATIPFEPVAVPAQAPAGEPWTTPEGIPVKGVYGPADRRAYDYHDT